MISPTKFSSLLVVLTVITVYFIGTGTSSGYTDGWKHEWSCTLHGFGVPSMTCDNGSYINLKTVFYGRPYEVPGNCTGMNKFPLPPGGCNMKEVNLKAAYSQCQAKLNCKNWQWPSEVCRSYKDTYLYKYNSIWYECVSYNQLTLATPASGTPQCCNGAVIGGYDVRGETLLVGRTYHNDHLLPCYITRGQCVFASEGKYGSSSTFEYLDSSNLNRNDNYKWKSSFCPGKCSGAATVFGQTSAGVPLLVGRAEIDGGLYVGNVDADSSLLSVGYEGGVSVTRRYEILML